MLYTPIYYILKSEAKKSGEILFDDLTILVKTASAVHNTARSR